MSHDAPLPDVVALRRYPVKSMGGELLAESAVDGRGFVGDREWAVYDAQGKIASGKHTRRFRRMDPVFDLVARRSGATVLVRMPDGRELSADEPSAHEVLSTHFREPVELRRECGVPHQDEGPLSLVGTATLVELGLHEGDGRPVDACHLRTNIVLATDVPFVEESWVGRSLTVGTAVVRITGRTQRCRMVGVAQVGLNPRPRLLQTIAERRGLMAGVYATVVQPGRISLGDRLVERAPLG